MMTQPNAIERNHLFFSQKPLPAGLGRSRSRTPKWISPRAHLPCNDALWRQLRDQCPQIRRNPSGDTV
jgi:hypothetical protein